MFRQQWVIYQPYYNPLLNHNKLHVREGNVCFERVLQIYNTLNKNVP